MPLAHGGGGGKRAGQRELAEGRDGPAILTTTGAPPNLPRLGVIWVEGAVFERTDAEVRPVAGASVTLPGDADPRTESMTLTNADGRYLVCPAFPGTGSDVVTWVDVRKTGYRPASSKPFTLAWDYWIDDVELVRE
jgi:hypothetical protein